MNRRDMIKLSSFAAAAASSASLPQAVEAGPSQPGHSYGRWDHVELGFEGPAGGNPFIDVTLSATFQLPASLRYGIRLLRRRRLVQNPFYAG